MFIAELVMLILFSLMLGWTGYSLIPLIVGIKQVRKRNYTRTQRRKDVDSPDLPTFSLIVPMKDEEKVAARMMDALVNLDYPGKKTEIVMVDDASTDSTWEICSEYERSYPGRVRCFRMDRGQGKPSVLNYALQHAKGEIVGVFDADNLPQPDVLFKVAERFQDEGLVAVQGLLSSLNADENMLTKFVHYEGVLHFDAFFSGRDRLGLFVPLAGTCLFVKRQVLEEVGGWQDDALSEDLELSARLTKKGYHVKFAPEVKSWQENPSRFRQLIGQRVRWFRGCLEVAFKYGSLLGDRNKRSLDADIFFFGPVVMMLAAFTYLLSLFTVFQPSKLGFYINILTQSLSAVTLATLSVLGVGLAYSTKPRKISNVKWVPFIYFYWSIQVFIALYSFLQTVFKRPRRWKKTSRTGTITNQKVKDLTQRQLPHKGSAD